mmetsp:Transcript_21016/g.49605  ORF Transcript_21016/g.49605 Transcript_21016/m.49605 type:complete len:242 (+) Transcript_21016:230-955(+)
MVYMNLIRHSSSRLISAPACQLPRQSLLRSSPATATTTTASPSVSTQSWDPNRANTTANTNTNTNHNYITTRSKHSSTQIKRLFKQNPAKRRIALREKRERVESVDIDVDDDNGVIPEPTLSPIVSEPKILKNGWNLPLPDDAELPEYPFRIARTKNKPNDAVGFLPVYSEFRKDGARVTTRIKKISGDRVLFLNELRAALQIPIPNNPKEDEIRIRTGGTIEVKGNRVLEVKTWLAGLGF